MNSKDKGCWRTGTYEEQKEAKCGRSSTASKGDCGVRQGQSVRQEPADDARLPRNTDFSVRSLY